MSAPLPLTAPAPRPTMPRWRALLLFDSKYTPLAITIALFVSMTVAGGIVYDGLLQPQIFLNLFVDNAFLLIVAVGMTFVILTGGIDLSVGSVIALTTVVSAVLVEHHGWNPWLVMPLMLLMGAAFGGAMGLLIQRFRLQPFVVTLGGMFLARGISFLISVDSISITNPVYMSIAEARLSLGGGCSLSVGALLSIGVLLAGIWLAHATAFGRSIYALGGSEASARLMGLPVAATQIGVYALSGACSALAGIVYTFYMLSGYSLHAQGLELDAIAAVVVGGTLLTGGSGYLVGTLFGVLILGLIQTIITIDGTLSSWWTKIVIGGLLFLFCLLQRLFAGLRRTRV
ncbi:galactofuranose ABC transporter, permease protein YjfF [Solimonas marina]|uniref:Sugar ABC transporter permease YjfF n=1 Tax=Solimonas marina TaxID=2714601 RepID=A0A970B693_9GAMM|nr:galactofuranose ABC transporter, permease protein YjfF [Solimonas marina]NKF24202.1 sugar ABC transporter permease YjfF [Solimonas marina]